MTTKTKSALSLAALGAVLGLLPSTPAEALNIKSYVAGTGSDANNCSTIPLACATFQGALNKTAPGGEITVVNTGDYGLVSIISQSVNITNDGAGEASVAANIGGGIGINAGAGDVVGLRGLLFDGFGAGTVGIQISSVSAVHIQNCVIRNLQASNSFGIEFVPVRNSQMFVSDTIIFNNGSTSLTGGILIEPQNASSSANVVLDRVHLENNVDGLLIDGIVASGAGSHVVVRDSVISGNAANGIHALTIAGKSPAFALVERSTMVNNGQSGIRADGPGATVLLKESTIARNGTGVSTVNSGQLISYGNNTTNNNLGAEGTATSFLSAF